MHLYKLVKVLKSFDAARITRLQKYVSSPYFVVYPPSVSLMNYLANQHPFYTAPKISVATIAAKHKNLSTAAKQTAAGTRLMRAVEDFIAQEQWQKNKTEIKRCELQGLRELGLAHEFDKCFGKEMKHLEEKAGHDLESFADKHLLTELLLNGFDAKLDRTSRNSIFPVVKTLDEFYAIKKLRYLCEALSRQQFFGIEVTYHEQHVPTLLHILEPYTTPQHPYVYLFVNVFRMQLAKSFEESEIPYRIIRQFAESSAAPLPPALIESMSYAGSHCLRWFNAGYNEAGNEYLRWIELKAKHHLLFDKGKLQPIAFRNIISIGVTCNKNAAWVEKVIEQYGTHLPPGYRESCLEFAQGLYHYTRKEHKQAIRLFMQAEAKEDVMFSSGIRRWHFMSLCECDPQDTDVLLNHLVSFEKYLLRNKKTMKHLAEPFAVFIDYAMKLVKTNTAEESCAQLSRLREQEHFPGKHWLLEAFAAKSKTRTQRARVLT